MLLTNPFSIEELNRILTLNLEIKKDFEIRGLCLANRPEAGALAFVNREKYLPLTQSRSDVFFIAPQRGSGDVHVAVSKDPFRAYAAIASYLLKKKSVAGRQGLRAKIGRGSQVAKQIHLGRDVSIGKNCVIGPQVVIMDGVQIADRVVVSPGTVIGADAFYFVTENGVPNRLLSVGTVRIGDDVEIGPGCVIERGVASETHIQAGAKIDASVHIGHGVVIGRHCLIAAQSGIAGKVILGDRTTIWGKVGILQNVTIGEDSVVYGTSVVTKSFPAGSELYGAPAQHRRKTLREMAWIRKMALGGADLT